MFDTLEVSHFEISWLKLVFLNNSLRLQDEVSQEEIS